MNPQKDLKMLVSLQRQEYTSDVHGKLVVSCKQSANTIPDESPVEWIFYLKGPISGGH